MLVGRGTPLGVATLVKGRNCPWCGHFGKGEIHMVVLSVVPFDVKSLTWPLW